MPFQAEMGHNVNSISENSDWYKWVHNDDIIKKTYVSGDFPDDGPDFWNNYKDFIDKAYKLGNNAISLGIDWSRLFRHSTENIAVETFKNEKGDVYNLEFNDTTLKDLEQLADKGAVEQYKEIFSYVRSLNLKIILTLYSGPMPSWLHDPVAVNISKNTGKTGWLNKNTVIEFGKYAYFAFNAFKDYVEMWNTVANANSIINSGYLYGNLDGYPPGISNYSMARNSMRNLAYAHNIAYKIIKGIDKSRNVGLSITAPYYEPENNNEKNSAMSDYVNYIFNELYIDSAIYGNFDNSFSGIIDESRPGEFSGADFIGIEYYNRIIVRYVDNDNVDIRYRFAFLPCKNCSDNYLDIYPEGLRKIAVKMFTRYHRPLIIMGNGIADASDSLRPEFIKNHLFELNKAIKEDFIPVKGYFYHSLMDVYEGISGFKYHFGLYRMEDNNFVETKSALIYKDICHNKSNDSDHIE